MDTIATGGISGTQANLIIRYSYNGSDYNSNTSSITKQLVVVSTGYWLKGTTTYNLDGETGSVYVNVGQYGEQVLCTKTIQIYHNDNGDASFSSYGNIRITGVGSGECSNGQVWLPSIPRWPVINFFNFTPTKYNQAKITFSANTPSGYIENIEYCFNKTGTWRKCTSPYFFDNLKENTKYICQLRVINSLGKVKYSDEIEIITPKRPFQGFIKNEGKYSASLIYCRKEGRYLAVKNIYARKKGKYELIV